MFLKFLKILTIWATGAFSYGIIEIIARGYTHISMGVLGGICLVLIGMIDQKFGFQIPLLFQMFISSLIITVLEFATGMIVNVWLGIGVWDYSHIPMNFLGQVCLPFCIIWFFLSAVGIFLEDYIRVLIFKEPKPSYKIF